MLSCNHVLARSDQATVGEMIVQPGLIDYDHAERRQRRTSPVALLATWLPLTTTNVDAAVPEVNSGAVN